EKLWRQHGFTVLLVTHDVAEAVAVADRVILIEQGRIGLDLTVDVARPRSHGSFQLAALESRVLERVLANPASPERPEKINPLPTQLRWALSTQPPRGSSRAIQAINVRNQFKGQIREIIRGDVLSEIVVQTAAGIVTSVITTRSVDELALQVGSEVIAFVKSTEVSIAKL